MLRRSPIISALAFTLLPALFISPPAGAQVRPPRMVVLTVDGTSIEDWVRAGAFPSLGAIALLASRTGTSSPDPVALRASAYATFGAGEAATIGPGRRVTDAGDGVLAGALGEALARNGLAATSLGDASGFDVTDAPAPRAVMRADGSVASPPANQPASSAQTWQQDSAAPAGRRTDYQRLKAELGRALTWATVVVVDLGDTARADRTFPGADPARSRWIARGLADAARFAAELRATLTEKDTLIVASLVPPLGRVREGAYLAAVAMTAPDGLLFSGTTRRPGVLSITDLAPTILARAGVPVPSEMQGRAARIDRHPSPERVVADLDADLIRARASRRPLTRGWLLAAVLLAGAAFTTIVAGRGRAPGTERLPRRWRDWLAVALVAVAATPAAMLVAPSLPGSGVAAAGIWTVAVAVAGALAARVAAGPDRALAVVAGLDVAVVIGDLFAGAPLASRSAIGFQIAGGGRFYGIDEGILGVLLGAALVAAGLLMDRAGRIRPILPRVAAALAALAVVAGAPALGSKFGAPFTLVPAFGVFVMLAAGRRPNRTAVIGIAIATVLLASSIALADALAAPAARSHIGREITGGTSVGPLVGRKLTALVRITSTTIWLPAVVLIAGPIAVLLARRRDLLARGFWGMSARRAALWAIATGCVFALGSNDTGIIVAAPAVAIASAAFYIPLLAPRPATRARNAGTAQRERTAGPAEPNE